MVKNNFDISKYLIKQKIQTFYQWGSKKFYTSDFVFLKSYDEVKNNKKNQLKTFTDFAVASGLSRTINVSAKSWDDYFFEKANIMLRSSIGASNSGVVDYLNFNNELNEHTTSYSHLGITPSFAIKIPENVEDLKNLKENISKITIDGVERHILSAGQYPCSRVKVEKNIFLEKLFLSQKFSEKFKPTGNYYTTGSQTTQWSSFSPKLSPEFEFNGEKYVRIKVTDSPGLTYSIYHQTLRPDANNKPFMPLSGDTIWCKVENIDFIIENYNNLPKSINPNSKTLKPENKISLTSDKILFSSIPFFAETQPPYCSLWQNSTIRAFLNSDSNKNLSIDPEILNTEIWDFTRSGFLYEALTKEKTPIKECSIPPFCSVIATHSFSGCVTLEKIIIPSHVKHIKNFAFSNLNSTDIIIYPNKNLIIDHFAFDTCDYKFIYLSLEDNKIILKQKEDLLLNKTCMKLAFDPFTLNNVIKENYRKNLIDLINLKLQNKIKFIPKDYVISNFPNSCLENYFLHKNHHKFRELVQQSGILTHEHEPLRTNSLLSLMNIYFALGGFSKKESDREKAFQYASKYIIPSKNLIQSQGHLNHLCSLCDHFGSFKLSGEFNPTFAKFFMKYYHKNNNFLDDDVLGESYLARAHNNFATILKFYPHKVVNTNNRQNILSPNFVMANCELVEYTNVDEGNDELAMLVGRYGYSQAQFDRIQQVFNTAKTLKDSYIIKADKSDDNDPISFRILKKNDPLGFVLGNITNCCQKFGSIGESCVIDGYVNQNAGFIVFEERGRNPDGSFSGEDVILGQAYIWYDPETKTICFDNVEVPQSLVVKLELNRMNNQQITSKSFIDAIKKSAKKIVDAMNREGHEVNRVTIGTSYNSLDSEFRDTFKEITNEKKLARHRSYSGYTDAADGQYIVLEYHNRTKHIKKNIIEKIATGFNYLNSLKNTSNSDMLK